MPPVLKTTRPQATLRKGRNDWFKFKNLDSNSADLYIYDEIGYWGVTASNLIDALNDVSSESLTVHINSPGGDVFDGIAILNALRSYGKNHTITTVVDGIAASAASFIVQAGSRRIMSPNSEMMIHEASGLVIGGASDMREMADLLDRAGANIASIYAERSSLDVETFRTAMRAETWYSAQEAVDAGLADEVDGKSNEAENAFDLSIYAYSGRKSAPQPITIVAHEEPEEITFNPETFRAALKGAFV